jgi:predicted dehydrogenase
MKLAMIGSYGHCNLVLDALADLPEVELAAAAKWGPDDPMWYVGKHPAASGSLCVYSDYRRMLDEVQPDIVGVFMPLYRLSEASIEAADRGCHIVSEKPLATTLEDLQRLRDSVKSSDVQVSALFNLRGAPAFLAARQAVVAGRIGMPILASAQKSYPVGRRDDFYRKRETYGGSIPWQAIHAIDFVSYCTGRDYSRVCAMQSNAAHHAYPGMEDNGAILLELVGGGHANIHFDYLRPWSGSHSDGRRWGDDRLRIAGSEGIIEIVQEGSAAVLMNNHDTLPLKLPPPRSVFADMVHALRGAGEALVDTAQSLRATEVALKARQSADQRQILDL